jgi:hypothetical protein
MKPLRVYRCIGFGIQNRLLLIEQSAPLGNVGLQGGMRAVSLNPMTSLFYSCPKEREVPDRPKLDLEDFRKLRSDLLKNLPHCTGILDQGVKKT